MLVAAGAALVCLDAAATLSCTISASPPTLSAGTYDSAANLDAQGSFAINCTRAKNDSKNQNLWIGLNQTASQTMAKPSPYPDTLAYGIYSDSNRTTRWTNGTTGGVAVTLSFGTSTAASIAPAFYMRANSGQVDKAAGTYSDTLNVALNLTNSTGQNLANTTLTTQASVAKTCSVAATAVAYSVSYPAFRASALVDNSQSVAVSCSKGTQVNLFLDQTTGVINPIGLAYQLGFAPSSAASTSGTASSDTVPMSFGLILTLPAGQAGTCATATCTGSDTRQVLVTY